MSQQRSDDPRRGGRMSSDVKETWNTEPVESTIGYNLDEADVILDGALRNGSETTTKPLDDILTFFEKLVNR